MDSNPELRARDVRADGEAGALPKTILIVDDEHDILDALRTILEDEGYVVFTASDGVEALAMVEKGPAPDAILVDVMMPIMGGREVVEVLRRKPPTAAVPIILMSDSPSAPY